MKHLFFRAAFFTALLVTTGDQTAAASQRWALLVGVDDYAELEDLKFAGADMRAMRNELLSRGFDEKNVFVLDDQAGQTKYRPTKNNVERQLDVLMQIAERDDLLLVAFSGHGVHVEGKSYLCPADARLDDPGTLIALDSVYQRLNRSPAGLKLLVVDCCRNDPLLSGRRAAGGPDVTAQFARDLLLAPEGIVLLSSCAPGQVSMEDQAVGHGVFMHFLIEGLHGSADADRDGHVSLGELSQFAGLETKRYVARQFNGVQTPKLLGDVSTDALAFDIGQYRRPTVDNLTPPRISGPTPQPATVRARTTQPKMKGMKAHLKTIHLRVGSQDIGTMGDIKCTIERYQGNWVWIRVHNGQEGWVNKTDVVSLDDAIDHFTRQIRAQPKEAGWYQLRAMAWEEKGDLEMALADISDAVRLRPSDGWLYNSRANIYNDKGDYQRALADYNEALRHRPNESAIWDNAAWLRYVLKDHDKSITNATRAIELQRTNARAYRTRGLSWRAKGDESRAIADFEQAIRFDPHGLDGYRWLAWMLATSSDRKVRDGKRALSLATRACELTDWNDYDCLDTIAAAYAQNGDFENAIKYGTQAFELAPASGREFIGKRLELYKAGTW